MHTPKYDALTEADVVQTDAEQAAFRVAMNLKITQLMHDTESVCNWLLAAGHTDTGKYRDQIKEACYELLGIVLKR